MNVEWLIVALAAVVLGIGGYIATLAARRKRLEQRLLELEASHLDDSGSQGTP